MSSIHHLLPPIQRCIAAPLTLALVLAGLSGSCGNRKATSAADELTLVVGIAAEPDSLNVYLSNTEQALLVANRTLPRLAIEVPPDRIHEGGLYPSLAQSWEWSDSGKTLTLHLAEGRRWDNGEAIVCEDLRYTLEAQTHPAVAWRAASIKRHILAIECPEPSTPVVRFDASYPGQLMDLNDLHILPRALAKIPFESWREVDWSKSSISGGPYRVASFTQNQQVVLERVAGWGGVPDPATIARIILRVVPDSSSRITQLLAGELDLVDQLSPEEVTRLARTDQVEIVRRPGFRYTYLGFNTLDPAAYKEYRRHREADCNRAGDEKCLDTPETVAEISRSRPHPLFGDPRVRRAITLALDREALIDSLLLGEGEIPASPFLAPLPEHDPTLEPWPYDPERAAKLLRAAGFDTRDKEGYLLRNGRRLSFRLFVQSGHALRTQAATLIQQQLRTQGIELTLEPIENSSFYSTISQHDTDAWIGGWRTSLRVDATENLHASSCGSGGVNFGAWTQPAADRIASRAREILNDAERIEAWRRWERVFHDEQPYTILFRPTTLTGIRRAWQGPREDILPGDPLAGVERWTRGDGPE